MAESRSLMVRSGMMTSFCAATVVTPFFVTVFMTGKEWGREREREMVYLMVVDTPSWCLIEKQKNGASCVFMGFS